MQYLFGEFRHKLDAKGRLSLPSDFRKEVPEILMVTKSPVDPCLLVYDIDGFDRWVDSLFAKDDGFDPNDQQQIARQRILRSRVKRVDLDGSGRIGITADFRQQAGLDKEVVLVGNGDHFEIWDVESWDEYCKNVDITGLFS